MAQQRDGRLQVMSGVLGSDPGYEPSCDIVSISADRGEAAEKVDSVGCWAGLEGSWHEKQTSDAASEGGILAGNEEKTGREEEKERGQLRAKIVMEALYVLSTYTHTGTHTISRSMRTRRGLAL
jgi:hypothetical protein